MSDFPTSNVRVIPAPPVTYTVDLCPDCVTFVTNGWDEALIGRPLPDPAPMSDLPDTLVGPMGNHDCEGHFSHWRCDGCGTWEDGTRFCYIAAPMPRHLSDKGGE